MDFLYHGEASVFQENLETFLAVAEELKLNGLTKEVKNKDGVENRIRRPSQKRKSKNQLLFDPKTALKNHKDNVDQKSPLLDEEISPFLENTVALIPDQIVGLDDQIDFMVAITDKIDPIRKGLKLVSCSACGKEGSRIDVKRHIEAKHIAGISHNCELCEKTTR